MKLAPRPQNKLLATSGVPRAWAEHFWTVNAGFRRVGEDVPSGQKFLDDPQEYYFTASKVFKNAAVLQNPLERNSYALYEADNPNVLFSMAFCERLISAYRFTQHVVDFDKLNEALKFEVQLTLSFRGGTPAGLESGSLLELGLEAGGICRYMHSLILQKKFLQDNLAFEVFPSPKEFNEKKLGKGIASYVTGLLGRIGGEGVTRERSHLVEDSKLESGKLPAIFEAQLDRQALADALNAVMAKEGLSEQKVADRTGFRKNDVNRARNGNATIDKTSEILAALGYPPTVSIPGLD